MPPSAAWLDANPGKNVPRVIGVHEFSIGGVKEKRAIFPYTQWMFQRPLDHYRSLTGPEKERADAWLKARGGYEGMQFTIRRRLQRKNNLLVPE